MASFPSKAQRLLVILLDKHRVAALMKVNVLEFRIDVFVDKNSQIP